VIVHPLTRKTQAARDFGSGYRLPGESENPHSKPVEQDFRPGQIDDALEVTGRCLHDRYYFLDRKYRQEGGFLNPFFSIRSSLQA
jgi:hypothetical protein